MKPIHTGLTSLMTLLALAACIPTNGSKKVQPRALPSSSGSSAITSAATNTSVPTLTITSASETRISNEELRIKLNFPTPSDNRVQRNLISTFCPVTADKNPCQCVFTWNEVNTTTPGSVVTADSLSVSYKRRAITQVVNSQGALVECEMPSVYTSEIGVGEEIRIWVEPVSIEQTPFKTEPIVFTKQESSSQTGVSSFVDNQGNQFQDIWRYVCHDVIRRSVNFTSRSETTEASPSNNLQTNYTENVKIAYASQFTHSKADSGESPVLSSQLNYFSLYVPNNRREVYSSNASFSCPQVQSGSIRPSAANNYFPFDSSFALASRASKLFNVPVEARSRLGYPIHNIVHRYCSRPDKQIENPDAEVAFDCLGYAASPRADGTCPVITVRKRSAQNGYLRDEQGNILTEERRTYRLRRFTALYPPLYDTNGHWISGYQANVDQIYVLDRPARFTTPAGETVLGSILGPKPCPFSWWDRARVISHSGSAYYATNDSRWTGKNADGIAFPTMNDNLGNSCPAVIPRNTAAPGQPAVFQMLSLTAGSPEAQIRPIRNAWAPLYWEDTSFQACAPEDEPSSRVRAPIHHFSNGGDASYCEEIYPTGHHGRSTAHPGAVVSQIAGGTASEQFPLLASRSAIESALQGTPSYRCQATYAPGTSVASGKGYSSHQGHALCCRNAPQGSSHADEANGSRCDPM